MKHDGSISNLTPPEIVAKLGERFKDYRIACDMTQKEVTESIAPPSVPSQQRASASLSVVALR